MIKIDGREFEDYNEYDSRGWFYDTSESEREFMAVLQAEDGLFERKGHWIECLFEEDFVELRSEYVSIMEQLDTTTTKSWWNIPSLMMTAKLQARRDKVLLLLRKCELARVKQRCDRFKANTTWVAKTLAAGEKPTYD